MNHHVTASSLISNRIQTMNEYFFAQANKRIQAVVARGIDVINLGIGSPDLPPPPAVMTELARLAQDPAQYPYPSYTGLPSLRNSIKQWYEREYQVHVEANNILPVSGSKEAIFFATLAFTNPDDYVLVPNPGYPTYAAAVQLVGAKVLEYNLTTKHNFLPDFETLNGLDLSKAKIMWINYPNNPTGATATKDDLQSIIAFARQHNLIIISDNPYSHVTFDGYVAPSILEVATADDLVIEIDSFSKTYNLAGVRLAWIVGHPELMTAIKTVYSNIETGIFTALQRAGEVALNTDKQWISERNKEYERRRNVALDLCRTLGLTATPPLASLYVWAKLPTHTKSAVDFCFDLLETKGIFITPGTAFGSQGEGFVRISLCQKSEIITAAIKRLS